MYVFPQELRSKQVARLSYDSLRDSRGDSLPESGLVHPGHGKSREYDSPMLQGHGFVIPKERVTVTPGIGFQIEIRWETAENRMGNFVLTNQGSARANEDSVTCNGSFSPK